MKKLIMVMIFMLGFLGIVLAMVTLMYKSQVRTQANSSTPQAHDAQGNVVVSDSETTDSERSLLSPSEFINKKLLYKINNLPPSISIETDATLNYSKDSFHGYCLSVYVIPESMTSPSLDKKILFPLSRIKQLMNLPIGGVEKILTGERMENLDIEHTYTRLENNYLGNQKAYTFEFGNNWEMLGNIRLFYTKKDHYHYLVVANYNDYMNECASFDSLSMVGNFQFLDQQ